MKILKILTVLLSVMFISIAHAGDKVETMYLENVKYGPDAERAIRNLSLIHI